MANKLFTATATTTYIGFAESGGNNAEIDTVEVVENESPRKLRYISHDEWFDSYSEIDLNRLQRINFYAYICL